MILWLCLIWSWEPAAKFYPPEQRLSFIAMGKRRERDLQAGLSPANTKFATYIGAGTIVFLGTVYILYINLNDDWMLQKQRVRNMLSQHVV